jgi:hypothetical protein
VISKIMKQNARRKKGELIKKEIRSEKNIFMWMDMVRKINRNVKTGKTCPGLKTQYMSFT